MSTLTKVLIVLLSFGAIFLCGVAISYVSSTSDLQAQYEDLESQKQAISADLLAAKKNLNDIQTRAKRHEEELRTQLTELQKENDMLAVDKRTAETQSMELQAKYTNQASALQGLDTSLAGLRTQMESVEKQLEEARAQNIRDRRYLNETTEELMAKTVRLEALESRLRQTLEEKQALEEQLSGEQVAVATVTPTPNQSAVRSESAPTSQPIRGTVTEVRENLIGISVGAADGVREGQTLHVTRGSQFICDVAITDVDTNKAAGVLQMVQQRPRAGDNVTTEL